MGGDIDFKEISAAEKIQINSQKTRFWKEKSVEDVGKHLGQRQRPH